MSPVTRPPVRARRGFTLAELLISMVMIGILGAALTRMVVKETRFSNRQVLQRNARAVSRGALNIMTSELRMAEQSSAFAGGVPLPTATSFTVNVPWAVGLRCTATAVLIIPVDSVVAVMGRTRTVAVGVRQAANGNYLLQPNVTATPAADVAACTGAGLIATGANAMPQLQQWNLSAPLTTGGLGSPIMLYYRVTYSFANSTIVTGRTALWRQVTGEAAEELVYPFASTSTFGYYTGLNRMPGVIPADLTTVTGIQLNLLGQSERNAGGQAAPESANLSTAIFFRNRL